MGRIKTEPRNMAPLSKVVSLTAAGGDDADRGLAAMMGVLPLTRFILPPPLIPLPTTTVQRTVTTRRMRPRDGNEAIDPFDDSDADIDTLLLSPPTVTLTITVDDEAPQPLHPASFSSPRQPPPPPRLRSLRVLELDDRE